jgi:cytoskeletal protein RodZ
MLKDKTIRIYIIVLLSILIILGVFLIIRKNKTDKELTQSDQNTEQESENLSPEEALEQMEDPYQPVLSEDASITITSPKEETFVVGQARMWEATLTGIEGGTFRTNCNWQFYMNDTLYRTRNNPSSASVDDNTTCGFTSTFIDIGGDLEVKLTVDVLDSDGEIFETYSTSRNYTVL